jgi:DNA invertase Pin-like site-specific DNA recombinase
MIGYARTSTAEQNIDSQIEKLKKEGCSVIFYDAGISGSTVARSRHDFKNMLMWLEQHPEENTILVFELSRVGRNLEDTIDTLTWLEEKGYRVNSVTEMWLNMPDPQMRKLTDTSCRGSTSRNAFATRSGLRLVLRTTRRNMDTGEG